LAWGSGLSWITSGMTSGAVLSWADSDFAHLGHGSNTGMDAADGRVGMVC
jgi:hypothetical protein